MKTSITYKSLYKPVFYSFSLLIAVGLVLMIEKVKPSHVGYEDVYKKEVAIEKRTSYPLRKTAGTLSQEELNYAKIAWKYFENNYQESTGLVNSVDYFPATTFWDLGSYLMGLTSAYEIGVIDSLEFDRRISKCLLTLGTIRLYEGKMPNKVYNTQNLQMVDYQNIAVDRGIGWSAMDLGRFFGFVNKVIQDYPQYQPLVKKAVSRWKMENMVENGVTYGVMFTKEDSLPRKLQEGKLGYEQYSAKGLALAGLDVSEALSYTSFLKFVNVIGIPIAVDKREVKGYTAYNFVTSEPYLLDGLEYGWDVNSRELAYRLFEAQKKRYEQTNIITCVSEDHLDTAPSFVYNSVYADGISWTCLAEDGSDASAYKTISTKAAFAWHVLYDDPYAKLMFEAVKDLYDPQRGWFAGKYESNGQPNKAISANTNGVILEALNYKMNGKLIRF